MKKILLIVQHSLQPLGGGHGVAAWVLEALKRENRVSVLAWIPIDFTALNHHFGTALSPSDFTIHLVYPRLRRLLDLVPLPLDLLRTSLVLHRCKKMKDTYDILLTVNNEADFGRRGIQYVHFPWGYRAHRSDDLRWYHFSSTMAHAYYQLCVWIAGFSFERMKQNLTLVNSNWTGTQVKARHGIESTTLYPPVPGVFPDMPWAEREDGFVCISRISPEKELDKIIDILAAVRAQGWPIHLHIIGTAAQAGYYQCIRRRVQENAAWVFLNENLSREELLQLITHHRYGIHGMAEEHFGVAVAEMVRGGCIVFVPRGGGQVEIVGEEDGLLYTTPEDAVAKITRTLSDKGEQRARRAYLATRQELFSTELLVRRIQDIVGSF